MSTLSELVIDLFAQESWAALIRLSRELDSDTKLESMGQIIRGVRHLEDLCCQSHLDYRFTPAQRRSYVALGCFIGTHQVLFCCSELPVLNDPQLVRHGLRRMDRADVCIVRTQAVQAVKARQIQVSHILIDWLIATDPKRWGYQDLYLMYEASVVDGKSDPWIFNKLDEMGVVSRILKRSAGGNFSICREFLDDVKAMNGSQLKKALAIFK